MVRFWLVVLEDLEEDCNFRSITDCNHCQCNHHAGSRDRGLGFVVNKGIQIGNLTAKSFGIDTTMTVVHFGGDNGKKYHAAFIGTMSEGDKLKTTRLFETGAVHRALYYTYFMQLPETDALVHYEGYVTPEDSMNNTTIDSLDTNTE